MKQLGQIRTSPKFYPNFCSRNMKQLILCLFFLFNFISTIPQSSCQSNSPQNIQTLYPFDPPTTPPEPPLGQLPPPSPSSKSWRNEVVVKAVAATAATSLVISGLFFFLVQRYVRRRRKQVGASSLDGNAALPRPDEFVQFNGNVKWVMVDEEGLDVLYWRNLQGEYNKKNFVKEEEFYDTKDEEKEMTSKSQDRFKKSKSSKQEIPLLRGKSSTSHVWPEVMDKNQILAVEKQDSFIKDNSPPPPPPPPSPPPPPTLISAKKTHAPPTPLPPPPPLIKARRTPAPPPTPKGKSSDRKKPPPLSDQGITGNGKGQVKLKPLHWDKVNPNVEHSMVWDKLHNGSFRFNNDLMEALFGSVANNQIYPQENINMKSPKDERKGPLSQVFVLDTRKSQNITIVLRSLAVSREDIVDALIEGQGLDVDILEKLTRIAPTKEEESEILAFNEDHTRLADAESFLYHVLKAIPSAFTRFNAMLFRSNYDSEIVHLKVSLQTLESGCNELRTRRIFLKLLEAILKAGNRMNAGTSRGNAQAFNLTSLLKLSDVKSTDGKTTLLHFVVNEVVRAEGKRCLINRSHRSSSSRNNNGSLIVDDSKRKEDREKEYIMFGLPVVGGISAEFTNVKKAATLDYDTLHKSCSALANHVAKTRQLVGECAISGRGQGFIRVMNGFLDVAEGEMRVMSAELTRVMELLKRTTEYYQAGATKDKGAQPLQLFVIVTDFLGMVDQECVDITRNMQKRKTATAMSGSPPPKSPVSVKFPLLPANFMSDESKTSSSDSDDDF